MQNEPIQATTKNEDARVLLGAIILDNLQTQWLVELADRFYPFDFKASFKLEACSKKIQRNMELITDLYEKQFGLPLQPTDMSYYTDAFRNRFTGEKHFLIVDREMAYRCLKKIHEASSDVVQFLRWASQCLQDKIVANCFNNIICFREVLVMILAHYLSTYRPEQPHEDALAGFPTPKRWSPSLQTPLLPLETLRS